MEHPSQTLAHNIVARLVSEGLMDAKRSERIQNQLAKGGMSAEDWRLMIELQAASAEGDDG